MKKERKLNRMRQAINEQVRVQQSFNENKGRTDFIERVKE